MFGFNQSFIVVSLLAGIGSPFFYFISLSIISIRGSPGQLLIARSGVVDSICYLSQLYLKQLILHGTGLTLEHHKENNCVSKKRGNKYPGRTTISIRTCLTTGQEQEKEQD